MATDSSQGLSVPSARVRLAVALGNTAHAWAVADTMADLLTLPRVGRSETFADLVRWVEWWEPSYLSAVTLEPAEIAQLKAGRWWPPVVSTKQISEMPPDIARRRIP